jgi:hypothetical protein
MAVRYGARAAASCLVEKLPAGCVIVTAGRSVRCVRIFLGPRTRRHQRSRGVPLFPLFLRGTQEGRSVQSGKTAYEAFQRTNAYK